MAVGEESVGPVVTGAMAEPETVDWSPGEVTVTMLVTDHEKVAEPE